MKLTLDFGCDNWVISDPTLAPSLYVLSQPQWNDFQTLND